MDNSIFERTIGLIGEDKFSKIAAKTIAIFGLGGVGGTCFESLVRTGFKHFIIVDFDNVDASNLNRQILYTRKDIGHSKVECAKMRALEINPDCSIVSLNSKASAVFLKNLDIYPIDFMVDAIDDTDAKIALAKYAEERDIPFIMSLGMANRYDVDKVCVTKLNKTTLDPLAKKMRYELKKNDVDISKIDVVFSNEEPIVRGEKLQSVMFTPSAAGLNISSFVLKYFINK
ncbi:MAG: ThiF family adenylyltransferase [Bacilli bacterium]|nr:ThiF family adenylyltransferase [Bacilli bacterium]